MVRLGFTFLFSKNEAKDVFEEIVRYPPFMDRPSMWLPVGSFLYQAIFRTSGIDDAVSTAVDFLDQMNYDGKVIVIGRTPTDSLLQIVDTKFLFACPCFNIDLLFIKDDLTVKNYGKKIRKAQSKFTNINGLCRLVGHDDLGDLLKSRVQVAMFGVIMRVKLSNGLRLKRVAGVGTRVQAESQQ